MNLKLQVAGMRCEKCVDKIEKFVGEIEGVSLIEVDLAQKCVCVEFEAPASQESIEEAILDSGFDIVK